MSTVELLLDRDSGLQQEVSGEDAGGHEETAHVVPEDQGNDEVKRHKDQALHQKASARSPN